jgi:phosphotransferase system enzyme I (PtsI)
MISSRGELEKALDHLERVKGKLDEEGLAFDPQVPVGIMVEVPAAVSLIDTLLGRVDFASIGTNDLIQYLLAVDRGNRKVANLYDPLHPAVLGSLRRIMEAAEGQGKDVSLCGELAGEPLYVSLLLGLGCRILSMPAPAILAIKQVVRSVRMSDCQALATECLASADSSKSLAALKEFVEKSAPGLLEGQSPSEVFS